MPFGEHLVKLRPMMRAAILSAKLQQNSVATLSLRHMLCVYSSQYPSHHGIFRHLIKGFFLRSLPVLSIRVPSAMDRRAQESPMDFSWANGSGPVDESSPFVKFTQQNRPANGKRKLGRCQLVSLFL